LQNLSIQLASYQAQIIESERTLRNVAIERDTTKETLSMFQVDTTSIQGLDDQKLIDGLRSTYNLSTIYYSEMYRRYTTLASNLQGGQQQPKYWAVATCAVCRDEQAPPNACLECGHVLCAGCAARVQECPFCRTPVGNVTKLFNVFHT
jgi:hypothetical protein